MKVLGTGLSALDDALGGFHVGDNIILENSVASPPDEFLDSVIREASARGDAVHYLGFDASPSAIEQRLPSLADATIVDCFSYGQGRASPNHRGTGEYHRVRSPQVPEEIVHALDSIAKHDPTAFFIVDSLNGMANLWGSESAVTNFYSRVCPRLFDAGNLALWVLHEGIQTPRFHASIGHIAQVVLSLQRKDAGLQLQILRATGRRHAALDASIDVPPEHERT